MAGHFKAAGSKGSGRGHQALQITCTASLLYLAAALGGSRDLSVVEHYEGPAYLKNVHKWKTLEGKRRYIEVLEKGGPREPLPPKQIAPGKPPGPDALTEAQRSSLHKSQRCAGMQGSACTGWWAQTSIPLKPPPQGNKECVGNCNNVGVCNHDIGECLCPAGFGGKDCTEKVRRPCSWRLREANDPVGVQIDEPGVFTVDGWSAARCAGTCDDVYGLCYCGYNSTYARIPAPAGSPWGTPPIRAGLPLKTPCQPKTDPNGKPIRFGHMDYQTLYGPQGWCNAPEVTTVCPCALESMQGHTCQRAAEAWCPNQCNLRGECILGWCKCDKGWYGHACDKMKAGTEYTPAADIKVDKFNGVWREPPHAHQPLTPSMHRKRPFIYVYDLPSEYNTRMIQLKHHRDSCNWRRFNEGNFTEIGTGVYMVETYLHEAMLTTTHRTLDPEEADFFYVPIYYTCFAWPILGWTDGPWFAPIPDPNNRPLQAAHMYLGAKRWLEQAYPYWNRSQGKDHIFLTTNDEGACFMPSEIYNTAIFLTHWGRTDLDHESGTAYPADNYTKPIENGWERHFPGDWRDIYKGHACYTPGKDLVIPSFKPPDHFKNSPLLGAKPLQRDILMYFKGDCGVFARLWWYSRGIRQTLFRYALEDNWWREYKIIVVHSGQLHDNYGESLARSKFCLVAPGDGWSARAEDAILHGCLPVVIQDEVEQSFHGFVDWSEFGVRIPQANMSNLPQILMAYTDEQIARMQAALAKVWHRFAYATGPWHRKAMPNTYNSQPYDNDRELWSEHVFAPLHRYPVMNDAFHTIMQWLYGRINTDKGGPIEGNPAAQGQ